MKIKEISIKIKKTKNYNSFEAGEIIELQDGDSILSARSQSIERCNQTINEAMVQKVL